LFAIRRRRRKDAEIRTRWDQEDGEPPESLNPRIRRGAYELKKDPPDSRP
jgi:hypothetical protein